jgi:tetratricopeptide (TPR) repeat protein
VSSLRPLKEIPRIFQPGVQRIREQYQWLYQIPVREFADGSRSFHRGLLYRCHGINLLFLKGDFIEMAFQHGRLLADQILLGAPPQSARMVTCAVASAIGVTGRIPEMVAEGIHRLVTDSMLSFAVKTARAVLGSADALDEAIALSEATGLPAMDLVRALFNPETMLMLARVSGGAYRQRAKLLEEVVVPAACCSSFAAWGSYSQDGEMIIGRNMDYPLNGFYDRFPTVIYFEPSGRFLRYMTFVSAGIHNAGLNAYNEAGIFLGSHTVPTSEMSARGVPVFATASQVIRRAKSFDTAVELFRAFPPPTGWAYTLVSTKERRVGTVELTNQRTVVREAASEFHAQTNHFLAPEMAHRQLFLNKSVVEDSEGRLLRMQQRLEQARGKLDAREAAAILSDQYDPIAQQVRGLGNTVGVHTNMTSVVLEPDRGRFHIAAGPAPAAHGEFIELPLIGSFDRGQEPRGRVGVIDNRAFMRQYPEKWRAMQLFIQAKRASEQDNDVAEAYRLLQEVVRADPSNPAYFFQLGIFALKNRRYDDALSVFDHILSMEHVTSQLRRLTWYYRGRTHAHQQRTEDAIHDLTQVMNDAETDEKLRTSTSRVLWRLRTWGRCRLKRRNLVIMMQQSDMLHY